MLHLHNYRNLQQSRGCGRVSTSTEKGQGRRSAPGIEVAVHVLCGKSGDCYRMLVEPSMNLTKLNAEMLQLLNFSQQ